MNLVRGWLVACVAGVALTAGSLRAQQVASNSSSAQAVHFKQGVVGASKPKVVVDASLRNHPAAAVVWIAYGVGLAMDHPDLDLERAAGLHVYVPSFDADLSARKNQIAIWNQLRAKVSVANAYMTQLEEIDRAGFLREYVWEYYRQSGWREPPGLKLDQFDVWKRQHLPDLKAETHAWLEM